MDFAIKTSGILGEMTADRADSIANNVFLSLTIIRGSWFLNPDFGIRDVRRLKNTEGNARLVRDYVLEALQWLLDSGRAVSVNVTVQRDREQDLHRLKAIINVVEASGRQVIFDKFFEVV